MRGEMKIALMTCQETKEVIGKMEVEEEGCCLLNICDDVMECICFPNCPNLQRLYHNQMMPDCHPFGERMKAEIKNKSPQAIQFQRDSSALILQKAADSQKRV